VVTQLTALLICAVGGLASTTAPPSEVGVALFHTFFSLSFALVTWIGPGVAAVTIASERSGRTWEALLLTGLSTRQIARGKFLAAFTYLGLYLVMLAPVGALSFLFGGITATEVLSAFALLALIAALAVGFGLSVSSALSSPSLAAIVTLSIAVFLSIGAYTSCGLGLSFAAHELWPSVVGGAPVWLPTAYVRASFGTEYVLYLILIPLGTIALLAWFFYETTISNMMSPSDDRVYGVKRWLLVATPAFTAMSVAAAAVVASEHTVAILIAMSFMFAFFTLCLFLFAGDGLDPSERVQVHWERTGASTARRLLGPGIVRTMLFVLVLSLAAFSILTAAGMAIEIGHGTPRGDSKIGSMVFLAGYGAGFLVFLSGLATFVRAEAPNGTAPRLFLLLALFVAFVAPWLVLAIAGVFRQDFEDVLYIAAPSPAYVIAMVAALDSVRPNASLIVGAGLVSMLLWAIAGLVLLSAGARRAARVLEARRRAQREFESRLAAEEAVPPAPAGEAVS
jgi:hypothetical protein